MQLLDVPLREALTTAIHFTREDAQAVGFGGANQAVDFRSVTDLGPQVLVRLGGGLACLSTPEANAFASNLSRMPIPSIAHVIFMMSQFLQASLVKLTFPSRSTM